MTMKRSDVLIIGGGIVGLATAYRLTQRHPGRSVTVVEKEPQLATHQTGHNSGVLHSGIYYKPGSLKAENCREGRRAMVEFCAAEDIPFDVCGKVIVAVDESELSALERIYERGQANGVTCEMIARERLLELEPHAAGVQAIHVPDAGIVDFRAACGRLAEKIAEAGGDIVTSAKVVGIEHHHDDVAIETAAGTFSSKLVINCAGLHCDRVTRLTGHKPLAKIVPFRGEYYELVPEARHLCRNLIYPVPDPKLPFLGVHFTRMIDGNVECGPNAVLALAREGYRWTNINPRDLVESLTWPGFLRMAARHWRMGMGEMWRSVSKAAFVKALSRLIPEIQSSHLTVAPSGVRAQGRRARWRPR